MSKLEDSPNASINEQTEGFPSQDNDYLRLRRLLLGADYDSALQSYVSKEDDAERVASVLAQAIRQSTRNDPAVSKALAPLLNKAIHESIIKNPSQITNVIFPIMGPAIRKSVAAALREMVQNLNRVLEQSFSPKGIAWRYKAWRAGVSYGRYVISQTLKFRVEQVLLVHRETGILLHAVADEAVHVKNPELLSSMLTAIQDFVCDSFDTSSESSLERIEMGDFALHICAGPAAAVAVAVRGALGEAELGQVNEAIELIHQDYYQALDTFEGDREAFESTEDILRGCLVSEELEAVTQQKRRPWLAIGFIFALALSLGFISVKNWQVQTEFERIIELTQQEEGYIMVASSRDGDAANLSLFRDSNSISESALLSKLSPKRLFVNMNVKTITFGAIDTAKLNALTLPAPVASLDERTQYAQLLSHINSRAIYFAENATELGSTELESIPALVNAIHRVKALNHSLKLATPQIMLLGFADSNGSQAANLEVSKKRAELVKALLVNNGIQESTIQAWGLGHKDGQLLSAREKRRVKIHVVNPFTNSRTEEP